MPSDEGSGRQSLATHTMGRLGIGIPALVAIWLQRNHPLPTRLLDGPMRAEALACPHSNSRPCTRHTVSAWRISLGRPPSHCPG